MLRAAAWDISSIMAIYSTTLLVAGQRYMPPKLTSSLFGEKMTQAAEAIFRVWGLALSA